MKRTVFTFAAAALSATALFAPAYAAPTQLELQVGIEASDFGKYTDAQLAQVKSVVEGIDNAVERTARVDAILNQFDSNVAGTRGTSGLTVAQEATIFDLTTIDNAVEREARIEAVVTGASGSADGAVAAELWAVQSIDNSAERARRIEAILAN